MWFNSTARVAVATVLPLETPKTAIAIGNFDGVHVGHRALANRALELAKAPRRESAVLFFDPHPQEFFRPDNAPGRLTTVARREQLLRAHGVDQVIVASFDHDFAAQSPAAFFERVLIQRAHAQEIVVGPDFAFGQGRRGTTDTLRELGKSRGIGVHVIDPVLDGQVRISSTLIRDHLHSGRVEAATRLLGRPHDVDGLVVKGDQRGRQIGFPTANLSPEPVLLPRDGVYAVWAQAEGWSAPREGVANLGVRPTFDAGRSLEVHLLDFEGDLYGETVRVAFMQRLRDEQRFDGIEALKAQLHRDCEAGRAILAGPSAACDSLF